MRFTRRNVSGKMSSGLTLIEVIVAMALLAIVGSAIVGIFAAITSLNRDSSADVDYARLVRSVAEGIADDWEVPSEWNLQTVGGYSLADYVANETGGACSGTWSAPDVTEVRVITITCEPVGDMDEQVYQFEVGSPNI